MKRKPKPTSSNPKAGKNWGDAKPFIDNNKAKNADQGETNPKNLLKLRIWNHLFKDLSRNIVNMERILLIHKGELLKLGILVHHLHCQDITLHQGKLVKLDILICQLD